MDRLPGQLAQGPELGGAAALDIGWIKGPGRSGNLWNQRIVSVVSFQPSAINGLPFSAAPTYSYLKAPMGSTFVARRAGT